MTAQHGYRPSLRAAWPLLLLLPAVVAVLSPDASVLVRLAAMLVLVGSIAYGAMLVRMRLVVDERSVKVRRLIRWRTYCPGDQVSCEVVPALVGRGVRRLVLQSERDGRTAVPLHAFGVSEDEIVSSVLDAMSPN